jgi:hypothetical protein
MLIVYYKKTDYAIIKRRARRFLYGLKPVASTP